MLFTYINPIVRMGEAAFVRAAADAGVDGVLVLDLPVEEAESFRQRLVDAQIDPIFLLSPTTTEARIQRSAELGRGFLYIISRLGVTGVRDQMAADAEALVQRVRRLSSLPLAMGFGISTPDQVAEVTRWADAAVVGSALVNVIAEHAALRRFAGTRRGIRALVEGSGMSARPGRSAPSHRPARRASGAAAERARGVRAGDRAAEAGAWDRHLSTRARGRSARARGGREHGALGQTAVRRLFERIIDEARRLERLADEAQLREPSGGTIE